MADDLDPAAAIEPLAEAYFAVEEWARQADDESAGKWFYLAALRKIHRDILPPVKVALDEARAALTAARAGEPAVCRDCGRSDGGCDREVEGAVVTVSAEVVDAATQRMWDNLVGVGYLAKSSVRDEVVAVLAAVGVEVTP